MNVIVNTDDESIKRMLVEHAIVMQRPNPPNDMAMTAVKNKGIIWLVVRFWKEGDSGYVAFGCPESTPPSEVEEIRWLVLNTMIERGLANGMNPLSHAKVVDLHPKGN